MINILKNIYHASGLKSFLLQKLPFYQEKDLKKNLAYCGENFHTEKNLNISYPEFCWIGSNVTIESNVSIDNWNGAILTDNSIVKKNVRFKKSDAPILINENTDNQTIVSNKIKYHGKLKTARSLGENFFFIVSTGRAGSTSIAKMLDNHPKVCCKHEPNTLLIQLATDYLHGKISREKVAHLLNAMYGQCSVFPRGICGESDQKQAFLIEVLAELLPNAKFVWLIRNAKDFARSATTRGWYSEKREPKFPVEKKWQQYRLNGHLCGEVYKENWANMSAHEKNCWYWSFCNQQIEKQFDQLSPQNKLFIRLEELGEQLPKLADFLGIDSSKLILETHNKGGKTQDFQNEINHLEKWCSMGMEKWYAK